MYWLVNIESKLIKGVKFKQVLGIRHEAIWATQKQAENITKFYLRAELMFVAISLEDFWVGMKGLSNIE